MQQIGCLVTLSVLEIGAGEKDERELSELRIRLVQKRREMLYRCSVISGFERVES